MPFETDQDDTSAEKGYAIFQIEITDRERFTEEYLPPTVETIEAHGGRILISTSDTQTVEGEWNYNQTAVLEFPSVEAAREWYEDEAYEEAKEIRFETTETNNAIIAPAFSPE